jgi:hypothetical protein
VELANCQKSDSSIGFETRKQFQNLARITIFKIDVFHIRLGSLMICTHNLITLTKKKEMTRYCESFRYGRKMLSTHIFINLMRVSVPVEDIKLTLKGFSTFVPTHAPSRLALSCPIMPIMDQHSRAHCKSHKLFTNNQNLHKQQRKHLQH